jgi:hypothetical protein
MQEHVAGDGQLGIDDQVHRKDRGHRSLVKKRTVLTLRAALDEAELLIRYVDDLIYASHHALATAGVDVGPSKLLRVRDGKVV